MILGTQYYRPPFPDKGRWQRDMEDIARAGLGTVQLWACWGWIEPEPGAYCFDDYDELVALSVAAGLKVVISCVAEIQPFWIHRVVPGSEMVDHMGRDVVSSLRSECNVGLTPGGCTDNPEVRERMGSFLQALSSHYRDAANLIAWDCWNETRWAVQADGFVCYCQHTLRTYREYLEGRHGGLDGLNSAWNRRYRSWDDVQPGKLPGRPYTDLMEFQAFLTERAGKHAAFRWQMVRSGDPGHPVVAHCGNPSICSTGRNFEQALSRGNDWDIADSLDGFGSSHFPIWQDLSDVDLGTRLEAERSAVRSKPMWVSELQGGGARDGINVTEPVPADRQQRWVWSAIGRGAKAIIFWCWRDEVFGGESTGFGLVGADGKAGERLAALRATADVLERHADLLDAYKPDAAEVGVLFEESNYHLDWAQYGASCEMAGESVKGYLRVLERIQVPYEVVDAGHLEQLDGLRLLIMPWPLVVRPETAERVGDFVERGGTLLVESELGAYDERGFYHDANERELSLRLGIRSGGRRVVRSPEIVVRLEGGTFRLPTASWTEALDDGGAAVIGDVGGESAAITTKRGRGNVIAIGTFAGLAYSRERNRELERFVRRLVAESGTVPQLSSSEMDGEQLQWRLGRARQDRLLFVTSSGGPKEVILHGAEDLFATGGEVIDLIGGDSLAVRRVEGESGVKLKLPGHGCAVLRWTSGP